MLVADRHHEFATVVLDAPRTEKGWHGDNTDGIDFLDCIEREAMLAVHDLDGDKRDSIIGKLSALYPGKVAIGNDDPSGLDLTANATPMGMKSNDPSPVNVIKLRSEQFAACVITKPHVSPFIEEARKRGCQTMFDAQAEVLMNFLTGHDG